LLPREEKETNRDYAYRVIRRNILIMHFPPGSTLNENEIAEALHVSRTPVHEAMARLKSESFVEIFPQSGTRVSLINIQYVRDGVFFRNVAEQAIYKEITEKFTPDYSGKLEENIERFSRLIERIEKGNGNSDPQHDYESVIDDIISIDDEFHKIAYEAANRSFLWQPVKNVCAHFDRIRYAEFALRKSNLNHVYEDHMKIHEYLLVGGLPDLDFEKFYYGHLTYFKKYFFAMYHEMPQYFIMDKENL